MYIAPFARVIDPTPNWGIGRKNGPILTCSISFLFAPHSDQSAISNRFRATPERYRQRDSFTITIADIDAAVNALASIAKRHQSVTVNSESERFRNGSEMISRRVILSPLGNEGLNRGI